MVWAKLGADIVKLWSKYGSTYLGGMPGEARMSEQCRAMSMRKLAETGQPSMPPR